MEPFAFSAPAAGDVRFIPAGYGVSLMDLREREFPGTVASAGSGVEPLPGSVPLARFFSLMRKLGVCTLAVDEPVLSQDIAEECEDLRIYGRFGERSSVRRITALKARVASEEQLADLPDSAWLGVAIWKEDAGIDSNGREEVCRRIFESVARRGDESHAYVRGEPERGVVCGRVRRSVRGHLFCQQNGLTNVCSHAALRTVTDCLFPGGLQEKMKNTEATFRLDCGVAYVLGLRPREVKLDGADVLPGAYRLMQLLYNHLCADNPGLKRMLNAMANRTLILRPLLISVRQYVEHLTHLRDWTPEGTSCSEEEIEWAATALESVSGPMWMVEVSIPELFPANLRKSGELLIRASFDPGDKKWLEATHRFDERWGLIFARLPGVFLAPERMTAGKTNVAPDEEPPENVNVFWCHQQPCSIRHHAALFGAENDFANEPPP